MWFSSEHPETLFIASVRFVESPEPKESGLYCAIAAL